MENFVLCDCYVSVNYLLSIIFHPNSYILPTHISFPCNPALQVQGLCCTTYLVLCLNTFVVSIKCQQPLNVDEHPISSDVHCRPIYPLLALQTYFTIFGTLQIWHCMQVFASTLSNVIILSILWHADGLSKQLDIKLSPFQQVLASILVTNWP